MQRSVITASASCLQAKEARPRPAGAGDQGLPPIAAHTVDSETDVTCHKRTHAPQQKVPYSITSSAWASNAGEIVRPSACAVFILIAT